MSDRAPNLGSLRPRPSRSPSGRAVANTGAGVALAGGGSLLLPRRRWRPPSWSSSTYKDLIIVVVLGLRPCVLVLQEEAAARLPSSLVVILIAIHHNHHHTLQVRGGDLAELRHCVSLRCRCCCASLFCLCVGAPLHCLSRCASARGLSSLRVWPPCCSAASRAVRLATSCRSRLLRVATRSVVYKTILSRVPLGRRTPLFFVVVLLIYLFIRCCCCAFLGS